MIEGDRFEKRSSANRLAYWLTFGCCQRRASCGGSRQKGAERRRTSGRLRGPDRWLLGARASDQAPAFTRLQRRDGCRGGAGPRPEVSLIDLPSAIAEEGHDARLSPGFRI